MARETKDRQAFFTRLFFSLLPVQILLIAIGCLNSVIDGAVASAAIGPDAMTVLGLYSPLARLIDALVAVMLGGSQILCGRFLGKNEVDETRQVFSLDITATLGISFVLAAACLVPGFTSGLLGADGALKSSLSSYLTGMAFGIPCQMVGAQMSAFLQLERQEKRTYAGIAVMVALNVGLDFLLVSVLGMGFLGLGLATSAANLAFCVIQVSWFLTDRATIRFRFRSARLRHLLPMIRLGAPGALVQGCLMIRGLVLNRILMQFCAPYGLAAFSAVNTFGCLYCAVYLGMGSAVRLLTSIYVGEEDRDSLTETMKTALTRGMALVGVVAAATFVLAVPFARLFFKPGDGAWEPAVLFFRLFPLSVPFSAVFIQFSNCYQSLGRMKVVNLLSVVDGCLGTCLFSLALAPSMGSTGAWIAQVLGCMLTVLLIPLCAWAVNKRFSLRLRDLMLMPADFGVPDENRMDITVKGLEEVPGITDRVIDFCLGRGIAKRRAFAAGHCVEEMTENVVSHGFTQRSRDVVIVRVTHRKEGDLVICLKDNCRPFNPRERSEMFDPEDPAHNIGIRMVSRLSRKMEYQFILGLNVLTLTL